jgi:RNA polymerase sigma-70 factor (ECF subfamily)
MPHNSSLHDDLIAAGLARRDQTSARRAYEHHARALLRFGMAMTSCIATAEDVVHDTFLELLRRPEGYDPERGPLRAYLYGIARHLLAKRLRLRGRLHLHWADPEDCEPGPGETAHGTSEALTETVAEQLDRHRDIEQIRAGIRALPLAYREVITWCDLEELPYSTVADILHCPIGTVRSRLHRARRLLASQIALLVRETSASSQSEICGAGCPPPHDRRIGSARASLVATIALTPRAHHD